MADFTSRETVIRQIEYVLPSGAPMGEFEKAYRVAIRDFRQRHGIAEDGPVFDDWATVRANDDEVVIRFEVKENGRG